MLKRMLPQVAKITSPRSQAVFSFRNEARRAQSENTTLAPSTMSGKIQPRAEETTPFSTARLRSASNDKLNDANASIPTSVELSQEIERIMLMSSTFITENYVSRCRAVRDSLKIFLSRHVDLSCI